MTDTPMPPLSKHLFRAYIVLLAALVGIDTPLLEVGTAAAQEVSEATITVSANAPVALLVKGIPAEELPVSLKPIAFVCVDQRVHNSSPGERWIFQRWSHGPSAECVTLTEPGEYRALYLRERARISVSTNSPLPLLIDGRETGEFPAPAWPESRVCLVDTLHYTSESERYIFQGWSHGPITDCVILTDPGAYGANYQHSVLVHQESSVGEARKSFWTRVGKPAQVEVPQTVAEGERVRYSFRQWDKGETPFRARNALAPLEPSTLTVEWTTEYLLTIEGPRRCPCCPRDGTRRAPPWCSGPRTSSPGQPRARG